ncbi:hypothetical protein H5410_051285 [Solanum commersonii]|uniref:Uncharacterized protein n=1 Tax=Solanum commersonii TaxID=4109 RepID=A0A9J5WY02_SOLCO|nr:hypothetical protein H5410_051285 [Solanum commersonii]
MILTDLRLGVQKVVCMKVDEYTLFVMRKNYVIMGYFNLTRYLVRTQLLFERARMLPIYIPTALIATNQMH